MIKQPIFLVGAERSGTTLLRLMLDHHPDITWLPEFEFVVDLVTDEGKFPSLDYFYEYLQIDTMTQERGLKIDKSLSYPELVNNFIEQKLLETKKSLVGATVHRNFERLLYIWSDARFIHIIRDPRDVARSNIGMGWAGNVWYGIERWIEAELLWEQFKKRISPERYIEIHYENLIYDPEKILTDICQFMNVNYDPLMLDYDQDTSYSKPNPNLVAQWRKKLSDFQIQLIELKVGDLLIKKEYSLSGLPALKMNYILQQKLAWQNWLYKVNYRINKFGLFLFLAEFLSRKLKLKSWNHEHRKKMNQITIQNLK